MTAESLAPDTISIGGDASILSALDRDPVVALLGMAGASEYGKRVASLLARELAAAGLTVACGEHDLAATVRAGVGQARGRAIVVGEGEQTNERECRLAEAAQYDRSPEAAQLADRRLLALLADLVVVVEAGDCERDLAAARLARSLGAPIAAVPGPIDARASRGANALIGEGAVIAACTEDLLDALVSVSGRRRRRRRARRARRPTREPAPAPAVKPEPAPGLDPRLVAVLTRVRGGEDTLAKLCAGQPSCEQLALALTELELLGLLRHAGDGSYAACAAHLG